MVTVNWKSLIWSQNWKFVLDMLSPFGEVGISASIKRCKSFSHKCTSQTFSRISNLPIILVSLKTISGQSSEKWCTKYDFMSMSFDPTTLDENQPVADLESVFIKHAHHWQLLSLIFLQWLLCKKQMLCTDPNSSGFWSSFFLQSGSLYFLYDSVQDCHLKLWTLGQETRTMLQIVTLL